jgi:hypothetical protein
MGSIIYTLVSSPRDSTRINIRVESQIFDLISSFDIFLFSNLWLGLLILSFYNNVLQGVLMSKPDNSNGSRGQLTAGTDTCHLLQIQSP